MILLAPVRALGGISTWAAAVREAWVGELTVIDTSPLLRKPSQEMNAAIAALGLIHGFRVWIRALALAARRRETIWLTSSPSIGFRARDVPFLMVSRILGVRTILHIHGSYMPGLLGSSRLSQRWAMLGIRSAAEVVTLDAGTQRRLEDLALTRIRRLPNFIHLGVREASPQSPPSRWLYVGRVSRAKGSEVLVELATNIRPGASLTVVGPIDPKIETTFRRACTRSHVRLTGPLPSSGVHAEMLVADVLILPSHHEGFPMVVLEAMSLGLPVISSDVGACREMLVEGQEPPAGQVLPSPELAGTVAFVSAALAISNHGNWAGHHGGGRARVAARYEAGYVTARMRAIAAGRNW